MNLKHPTRSAFTGVEIVVVIAVLGVGAILFGPQPKGKGSVWYAPRTWGSAKPGQVVDAAKAQADATQTAVTAGERAVVHNAAREVDKAVRAAEQLPPSAAATVVSRTAKNSLGLLSQVSPLSAAEVQDNTALVLGLLATEVEKRTAAEAKQADAEKGLATVSADLVKAQAAHVEASKKLATAEAQLREAFDDRNALANELHAQRARGYMAIGVAVVLLIGVLYFRATLGSMGAVLHQAEKILPVDKFHALAGHLDGEVGKLAQWAVREGKAKAAAAEAKARSLLSGKAYTPPPT